LALNWSIGILDFQEDRSVLKSLLLMEEAEELGIENSRLKDF